MHHLPGVAGSVNTAAGSLRLVASLVFTALVGFHAWMSARTARTDGSRIAVLTETGHLLVAAGMAYMFSPPDWQAHTARVIAGSTLAWGYLALSSVFLTANAIWGGDPGRPRHPATPEHHDAGSAGTCCCALLAIEGLAMAYMNALQWWSADDLTIGFFLLFAAVTVLTTATLVLRLVAGSFPAGGPATRMAGPIMVSARGASVRIHGRRLIMSVGMVAMFTTVLTS
ncbi:DUF5134 domain-containing protein [Candidatus Protofrankia californiensis]|uniref:DUF5134 domain-containing protein n=1 Tax=Candidatus Protofrankia californiensis TaxID=1839754 RepID=UPI0013EA6D59|nr:DUF5134 domain-containing protein [Candidatus Protofrankia californiensis]